jgi:hypothetical protein
MLSLALYLDDQAAGEMDTTLDPGDACDLKGLLTPLPTT